jgi:hypothetical protein
MDPGTVVWLPGTGWSGGQEDLACQETYPGTYACGSEDYEGGTLVGCCPY